MFGSVVLDVAIGMAFVYLLLSLIASVVQEMLSAFMQLRPANLLRGLRSLFSGDSLWGKDLVDSIYSHGLIRGLFADPEHDLKPRQPMDSTNSDSPDAQLAQSAQPAGHTDITTLEQGSYPRRLDRLRFWLRGKIGIKPEKGVRSVTNQLLLPAYIPSRTFALALIDILNNNKVIGEDLMKSITQSLADHNWIYRDNKVGQALYALAVDAKGDVKAFQKNIENWYNDSMDRASGWYKRYTQRVLFFIGLGLAVMFNVNSVRVAQTLWFDRDARVAMASAADEYVKVHPNPPELPKKDDAPASSLSQNPSASAPPTQASADVIKSAELTQGTNATPTPSDGKKKDDTSSRAGDLERKLQESADAFNTASSTALLPVGWKLTVHEYWTSAWGNLGPFSWTKGWWDPFLIDLRQASWTGLTLLIGWLVTACAVSLGAPFWFDLLNKIMVVRSTIKPQEKSQTEGSKDKAA